MIPQRSKKTNPECGTFYRTNDFFSRGVLSASYSVGSWAKSYWGASKKLEERASGLFHFKPKAEVFFQDCKRFPQGSPL